jgi:hypothetical protein
MGATESRKEKPIAANSSTCTPTPTKAGEQRRMPNKADDIWESIAGDV